MEIVVHLDLAKLAATLEGEQRHSELVRAINRAAAAGSTMQDLRDAQAALKLIEQTLERSGVVAGLIPTQSEEGTLIGALFTQAVVLYARATATKGKRPKLLGEDSLTPGQRVVHREVMKLRDSAIAHFGRGEVLMEGPLVREAVLWSLFRSPTGPKKRVGVYTTRAQNKAAFEARLAELIEVRLAQISQRQQRLFNEADDALQRALEVDPALGPSLRQFEFDIDAFCVSADAAARMRADLEAGTMDDIDFAVAARRSSGRSGST